MKPPKPPVVYATVPRLLPHGGTVLVLGSGPSLTKADIEFAAARVDAVIAVNDTYRHIPNATCLYAADEKWMKWHHAGFVPHIMPNGTKYPAFTGLLKYSLKPYPRPRPSDPDSPVVQVLHKGPETGLTTESDRVALGRNGCYQAVNIGIHFGATRILLLGVDMQGSPGAHDFGRHPDNSGPPVNICIERFKTMVEPLKKLRVQVINCTRQTALKVFPCVRLEEALAKVVHFGMDLSLNESDRTGCWPGVTAL